MSYANALSSSKELSLYGAGMLGLFVIIKRSPCDLQCK
jgi:hypothetical protein